MTVGPQLVLPASPDGPVPVAAYVRMSTEHQQYSTENQLDRIKEYATKRGMAILRVFADEGKSGLSVRGRESLRRMIAEVEAGQTEFRAILAYDLSRWGRFQDADESGYYEYICKRAGISVHYCAEQFENDGSRTARQPLHLVNQSEGENRQPRPLRGTSRLARARYHRASPGQKDPGGNAPPLPANHARQLPRHRAPQPALQESFAPYLSAIQHWPLPGCPDRPGKR